MNDTPTKRRRSIRLADYDYAQAGGYFVTICTHDRRCLLGEIVDAEMRLNDLGQAVHAEWLRTVAIRTEIALDEFIIMPNHLHGILFVAGQSPEPTIVGATSRSPLRPKGPGRQSLGAFVAGFKAAATRRCREVNGNTSSPLWQRGYYEHIIRDDRDLDRIRRYVAENPGRWAEDSDNPANRR